ncbi:hypothetical protein [Archangium sp. Cb G35]|uniref:hypothetical protein n=1 Tax=Archangium sp. Cb G35 TaxID=1920190 RepID=UPI000B27A05F|nr:hypothetical protein [Archangium sp. Cb G35]
MNPREPVRLLEDSEVSAEPRELLGAASFRARYPTFTHGVRIQGLLPGPRP